MHLGECHRLVAWLPKKSKEVATETGFLYFSETHTLTQTLSSRGLFLKILVV